MEGKSDASRAVALVGPGGTGKTSLAETLLHAAGAISRLGSVDGGTSIGDSAPEARSRHSSTEPNFSHFSYMGDDFSIIDTPGAIGFAPSGYAAAMAADIAIVVVDPDPSRAVLAEPALRMLEAHGIPHALFVNRIDQAKGSIRELLEALQPLSKAALVARQLPILQGERITGFIDLALERAFHYRPGEPSQRIDIPSDMTAQEVAERFHMLEQLADHDDVLLEQLLSDVAPDPQIVFADLAHETESGLVVPVLFGSALNGYGVRRLLKLLRHDTPHPAMAASRLGLGKGMTGAYAFRVSHAGAMGRLAVARIFGGTLAEGAELHDNMGQPLRAGALFSVQGSQLTKAQRATAGQIVAIGKAEGLTAGQIMVEKGKAPAAPVPDMPQTNAVIAIATRDRKDDVRLSTALNKLAEEDPALHWGQDGALHETLLKGVNDEHLAAVLERLKQRFGVTVDTRQPGIAYRESARKAVSQRGRHKKQSGGHGQFGDVVIEVQPLPRGEGFRFEERITGGAVPRQWIPAVEQGVRDAMERGPLGFPVVDVAVTLIDGSYHSVDSSELAFRTAGRIAMAEALAAAAPYLLEPVCHLTIHTPGSASSRITSAVAGRRGQMLGMAPRDGWARWDTIEALMPEAELQGLDAEFRSLSQGLASFEVRFDHLAELGGRLANDVLQKARAA